MVSLTRLKRIDQCVLNGDALAAFLAASLQDEPAGTRGHAGNEPVNALTAALLRLVRSL